MFLFLVARMHTKYSMLFVFIAAYAYPEQDDIIFGTGGKPIQLKKMIMDHFTKGPELVGKEKIFFIQVP